MKLQSQLIIHQAIALYYRNFGQFLILSLRAVPWLILSRLTRTIFVLTIAAIPTYGLSVLGFYEGLLPRYLSNLFNYLDWFSSSIILIIVSLLFLLLLPLSIYFSARGLERQQAISNAAARAIVGAKALPSIARTWSQCWQLRWSQYYQNRCFYEAATMAFWLLQGGWWMAIAILLAIWSGVEAYCLGRFRSVIAIAAIVLLLLQGGWWIVPAILLSIWMTGESYLSNMLLSINQCSLVTAIQTSRQQLKTHLGQIFSISLLNIGLAIPMMTLLWLSLVVVWNHELDYQKIPSQFIDSTDLWDSQKNLLAGLDNIDSLDWYRSIESLRHLLIAGGGSLVLFTLFDALIMPLRATMVAIIYSILNPPPANSGIEISLD
jgi:hypothetical protein